MRNLFCTLCLALTTIALIPLSTIRSADAQEQTLSLCNTPRNAIRVHNMNGRTMMRIFNRQANRVTLNATAQRVANPEGITYTAGGETTYTMFAANPGNTCSFRTSSIQPESGTLAVSESSLVTTLALCQGSRNTIRVYRETNQLKMRAFDKQTNATWVNGAPANQQAVTGGVNYTNTRGEVQILVNVPTNSQTCTITVGNQPVESGKLLERS